MHFEETLRKICKSKGWRLEHESSEHWKVTTAPRRVTRIRHLEDGSTWVYGRHIDSRNNVRSAMQEHKLLSDEVK